MTSITFSGTSSRKLRPDGYKLRTLFSPKVAFIAPREVSRSRNQCHLLSGLRLVDRRASRLCRAMEQVVITKTRSSLWSKAMPRVHGILETALYVSDVKRAADFYRRLFGFATLLESDRLIALNVADRDVLLLFQQGATNEPLETAGGVIPGHSGTGSNHLAFAITPDEVSEWLRQLESENVTLESTVTWTGSSQSFYFRDLDDNLVELTTPGLWSIY